MLSFLLLTGGELVLLVVLLPALPLARMAFGKKWWIEARIGFRPYGEEEVGDWRASGQRIRSVAAAIERGDPPQRMLGAADADADADETTMAPPRTPYDPPREGA